MSFRKLVIALLLVLSAGVQAQTGGGGSNPFLPPNARIQYAPDRTYDLRHVAVTLTVDPKAEAFSGSVVNTLAPLGAGLREVLLHCAEPLEVSACTVDGRPAEFTRKGDTLTVALAAPAAQGKPMDVSLTYTSGKMRQGGGFMGGGGWHWIRATASDPNHVGFWTQGEENNNHQWAPTWDYPNDFATSETTTTVPSDWFVVGNGTLVSDRTNKAAGTRTFHWRMTQPHATYLLSLLAGPLDTAWSSWQGVKLLYVVPKGSGDLIEGSFGDTPDMLSFFSRITGVKYPWPKYAQSAMYDFGGGMENVSATTLGSGSLTNNSDGTRPMASLNSHELAHQWFGDLVTCEDWGQVWLNESFATFFEALYMEHSRGKDGYDQDIEAKSQSYFNESRRYVRPLSTKLYGSADSLFDSHAYPKGGVILHSMRRLLGDDAFFAGVKLYLEQNRHKPVVTQDFSRALTQVSGVNMEAFFDQWITKPGHPVLDYSWTWDAAAGQVVLTVKQTQDTTPGTPIYDLPLTVGLIADGKMTRCKVRVSTAEAEVRLAAAARPDALLLDPDHDYLREMRAHWSASELPQIVKFAPNSVDRQAAAYRLLADSPAPDAVKAAMDAVAADTGRFPAFTSLGNLTDIASGAEHRAFYRGLLDHKSSAHRTTALRMLAAMPADPADQERIAALIDAREPSPIVEAAITALKDSKAPGRDAALLRAARMKALRASARVDAASALAAAGSREGLKCLAEGAAASSPRELRLAALSALAKVEMADPAVTAALRAALKGGDVMLAMRAVKAAAARKERDLLPEIHALAAKPPTGGNDLMREFLADAVKEALAALEPAK